MEWTHFLIWMLGIFIGSFLMTVWQNERKRREGNYHRRLWVDAFERGRFYPPAKSEPPPAPPKVT
jgi:hypothetical protein